MHSFFRAIRRFARRHPSRMVRPWALAAPLLVIVAALPLLRPLRYPSAMQVSDEEMARLATIQAIVEHRTLSIDATDFTTTALKVDVHHRWYSDQTPMMSAMLSGPYWIMQRNGLTFARNAPLVEYLLTLLGVTIPAACAAGLVYRMGRLFELRRPWRMLLAMAAVFATGLISYATVLNAHAPAAALILAAAACFIHLPIARRRGAGAMWLIIAGFCAALGAAMDPSALPFLFLFIVVILVLRWPVMPRLGGVLAYAIGAALPIALHIALTAPVTGDLWQGVGFHPRTLISASPSINAHSALDTTPASSLSPDDEDDGPRGFWSSLGYDLSRIGESLLGDHGVLSHFPVLIIGVMGVGMVMHRHWPMSAKVLASVTLAGAALLILTYTFRRPNVADWRDAMFAARWFIVLGPLILLWAGAWLRRPHHPIAWALTAALLAFSVGVSLVGAAAGPLPRQGFSHYTAAEAVTHLIHPHNSISDPTILAGR